MDDKEPLEEQLTEQPAEPAEKTPAEAETVPEEEQKPEVSAPPAEYDAAGKRIPKPYKDRYYLLYGGVPEARWLDLRGTSQFLQQTGFDGGELRKAREGKDYADNPENLGSEMGTGQPCSYCGAEITGIGYDRLPDGRLRCTTCSRTLVKTKEELQQIYRRVMENLETFFNISINVPIEIEVLDEKKLKKKSKRSIDNVDDQSVLILGLAVKKKKEYYLYLENGAPRISLIATFTHELTHIWQYTHWEHLKLSGKRRLVVYEGMAKWAEIQYLYLIGETTVARREEERTRQRQDEYGIGFCMYADQYPLSREAMNCPDTPFITDRCPLE